MPSPRSRRLLSAPTLALAAGLLGAALAPIGAHAQDAAPGGAAFEPIDRILVVVNDDVITASELNARVVEVERELAERRIAPPPRAVLRRQVLERMVLERVQVQQAEKMGIRVTDQDVQGAIRKLAQRNKLTLEQFYQALQSVGIGVDAYRRRIRDQLTIERLLEREINNKVVVSDAEVEDFLAKRKREARPDAAYNLSHILIAVPESASPEQLQAAKQKAEEIRESLARGASFEQAAIAYSQAQEALQGGALGWKDPGQLPTLLLDAVQGLEPGALSELVRSPVGFHLLRLNDRREARRAQPVMQTHVRHILMRPSELQSIAEVKSRLAQLRERVVTGGEDFASLARAYSEDAGSAGKGGDLGWMNPGQTVPEFERHMNALAPNQLSEPVETPFGIHLLQVLGRREHDVSEERELAAAREQLHARKADEQYEQWLRRLRDEAYVDVRTEQPARGS